MYTMHTMHTMHTMYTMHTMHTPMHTPMRMPVPCTRAILPSRALLAWVCPLHLRGVPSTPAWCAL
jgi:hypothetical protein